MMVGTNGAVMKKNHPEQSQHQSQHQNQLQKQLLKETQVEDHLEVGMIGMIFDLIFHSTAPLPLHLNDLKDLRHLIIQ